MKNILINFAHPVFGNNSIFHAVDINNLNEPWKVLKKRLLSIGYILETVDQNSLSNCDWMLFVDGDSLNSNIKHKKRNLCQECVDHKLEDKMALLMTESKAINPQNYTKQLHDKFSTIFTWDDDLVDNKKFFKLFIPYPKREKIINRTNLNNRKTLVNISANKLSRFPCELYNARRKSIKFFEKKLGDKFDLYGPRWNKPINRKEKFFPFLMPKFKSYKGIAKDKIETLSHYKFSLCYENAYGLNGYVTEKIFDCFNAGTVPIYWGAENITEYVDKNAFIDRRKFKSDKELFDFLNNINENEYNKYLTAIEKYLTSDNYKLFLPENFANTIIKTLDLKTNL